MPMSSAFMHGLKPVVLGLGAPISWGGGMGMAWNSYRDFVWNKTCPQDVVLLFDAYDVMFQGGEEELLAAYDAIVARTGRKIVYNADLFCSSDRKAEFPPCETPWCYLNSGIYMGSSTALRQLFAEALAPKILDKNGRPARLQNHHIDWFLDHQDIVTLDYSTELTLAVMDIPGIGIESQLSKTELPPEAMQLKVSEGRLHNLHTNTTPLILHFPGPGHWPDVTHAERTGTCVAYEFLRLTQPAMLSLMETRGAVRKHGGQYYGFQPWKPVCTFYATPFDLLAIKLNQWGDVVTWVVMNAALKYTWSLVASVAALLWVAWRLRPLRCLRGAPRIGGSELDKVL